MAAKKKEPSIDDDVDALFAAAPEEFVAERDELAKRLRAAGEKESAATVKALRKPTLPAWALNQVARSRRKDVGALLEAGAAVAKAQRAAASGRGAAALRTAGAERRKLVGALTDRAMRTLADAGYAASESQREAIANTLEAAAADADIADQLRLGRLSKEAEAPSGFGGIDIDATAESSPNGSADSEGRAARERRRAARAARAQPEPSTSPVTTAAATRVSEARAAAEQATAEAQLAAREAAAARNEVSSLQDALVTANGKARLATERAHRAQAAAAQAQRDLDDAERSLTAASAQKPPS